VRAARTSRALHPAAGWSGGGVRLFAALLVVFQVVQGVLDPIPSGNVRFTESYYLVTYNHGFVRRGLLGEGLRLAFGVPTRSEVDMTADLVVVLAIGAVLVIIELLIRRETASSYAMAILLAASPFTIDFLVVDRRPDLLAVVLLVALGIVLARVTNALLPWLVAFGLAFGGMVLVHEDVVLIDIPWAMVLVAAATLGRNGVFVGGPRPGVTRTLVARVGVLVAPSVIATFAVLAYGLPTTQRVAELERDVSSFHFSGNTVFTYLPNSIHAAVHLVGAIPDDAKLHTLLLGFVLIALQLGWIASWVRPRIWSPFVERGNRALGICLGTTIVIATVILFGTGFDWVRWFADCGAAWLIVQAFSPLSRQSGPGVGEPRREESAINDSGQPAGLSVASAGRVHLSHWLPALAVYLAMVPPLDDLFITGQLRHFFFFV
jgi:hypothetical protein